MTNQLTLSDEATYAMAAELAELTGKDMTEAVIEALRDRLAAERQKRDRDAYVARAKELAADLRAHMAHPLGTSDHSDLYDDDGLPA